MIICLLLFSYLLELGSELSAGVTQEAYNLKQKEKSMYTNRYLRL